MPVKSDDFNFLKGDSYKVAPRLLGCYLQREVNGETLLGKIVEVEAYDQTDLASHSYKGKTPRSAVMFGEAGHLYVYFTYGMHYCCNIVVGPTGHGAAVLIRAVEPIKGQEIMKQLRNRENDSELTNGPAKFCQAFAISKTLNGHDLHKKPLKLLINEGIPDDDVVQTTRIGISQAKDVAWRFYIKQNPFVSKF